MPEEVSTGKAAPKAAEREEAGTRASPEERRRREEGGIRSNRSKTAPQAELTAVASYDDLVELNRAGMDATLKASEAMLKATSSLAEELTSFACQRLRTDVETGGALLNSSNEWGQAVNLLGKFAADAVRDYLEEMARIAQLSAQTTRDVWTPLQEFSTGLARGDVARPS
jgi:Phasin protein